MMPKKKKDTDLMKPIMNFSHENTLLFENFILDISVSQKDMQGEFFW